MGKTRKLSAFNVFMKQELKRIKAANPKINHMVAFKQAAKNWKKGKPSLTRKGHKDFVTHKGVKKYNRKGHRQTKNSKGKKGKPYKHHKSHKKHKGGAFPGRPPTMDEVYSFDRDV